MISSFTLASLLALPALAVADLKTGNDNLALYWGQNSAGGATTQQNLAYYCQNSDSDVVLVSFLSKFSGDGSVPTLNLANACGTTFANSTLLDCPFVGNDIQTCQSLGKKVLLSIGGAAGGYDLTSAANARALADQLWAMFGAGTGTLARRELRPFGTAVVDGFDLDIESGTSTYYPDFVARLRELYATDLTKTYYVSAAPQCPVPDAVLNDAITKSDIDFLFVQFYNNACGMQAVGTDAFNFAAWDSLVKTSALNKNAKVYLGVPGGPSAAAVGYTDPATVIATAKSLQATYTTFGGVMVWDASQAWANANFANSVKAGIVAVPPPASSISSASTAASTSIANPPAVTKCVECAEGVETVINTFTEIDSTDCDSVTTVHPTVTAHAECETLTVHTTYLTTVPCDTSAGATGPAFSTITVETHYITTITPSTSAAVAQTTSSSPAATAQTASPAPAAVAKTTSSAPAAANVVSSSAAVVPIAAATTSATAPVVAAASKPATAVAQANGAARVVPGLFAVAGLFFL